MATKKTKRTITTMSTDNGRVRVERVKGYGKEYNFKKGMKKAGGRRKGVPNKITVQLRQAVLLAANAVGRDGRGTDGIVGYLIKLAKTEQRAFASLLGRCIPLHITGIMEHEHKLNRTKAELIKELEDRGIPVTSIYGAQPGDNAKVIEGELTKH